MRIQVRVLAAAMAVVAAPLLGAPAAQAQEQYMPAMVYRTGQFAPLGVPWADGKLDYYKLLNARGGINGVKLNYEECETAYDTAKGVECYERMKARNGGAPGFDTQSTGITFAVTDRAPGDKIPVITTGYGLSQ
ncbi:MAG: ABC transporter permease, partial [Comamonadaceae bacterium]